MRTWVDASAIIALDTIGELGVLRDVLGDVYVTREVAREVLTERASRNLRAALGSWIHVKRVRGDRRRLRVLGLGRGEASFFLTPKDDVLLLDEVSARRAAEAEGRRYTGLIGLLVEAAGGGLISRGRARDIVEHRRDAGFRMTVDLYEWARSELG